MLPKDRFVLAELASVICMQLLVLILTEEWAKGAFREEGQTQLHWVTILQLIKECNIKDYS